MPEQITVGDATAVTVGVVFTVTTTVCGGDGAQPEAVPFNVYVVVVVGVAVTIDPVLGVKEELGVHV